MGGDIVRAVMVSAGMLGSVMGTIHEIWWHTMLLLLLLFISH